MAARPGGLAGRLLCLLPAAAAAAAVPGGAQPLASPLDGVGQECRAYLTAKGFQTPESLRQVLNNPQYPAPCAQNATAQQLYAPNARPSIPGATDTTGLACRYGNPSMWGHCGVCCGLRPHFNWIVATCEETQGTGQFCQGLPKCAIEGSPKINYVAAYQYDGQQFVLMEDSTVGELSAAGVAGNYNNRQGWEAHKAEKRWRGGDWTTKYAPWSSNGAQGPRGVTPPAGLWVLSAENFYYGAFYMLTQLGINLEGMGEPTGTNCWNWELDPVEGTAGWEPGKPLHGNLNMLYSTNNAQVSGCMPVAYNSAQANGGRRNFSFPEDFRAYCAANPTAVGCRPWQESISWSGGAYSSHRFENLWDVPYVFAIVVDSKGYWVYRWRPDAYAKKSGGQETGWAGLGRFQAARTLPARPTPVRDPRGLQTDVPGDVAEAVILQPSLPPEAACLRASIEQPNWQFGSNALAAIAHESGQDTVGGAYEGAQNWWTAFVDTQQNAGYPMSIAGVPTSQMAEQLTCNTEGTFSCACAAQRRDEVLRSAPTETRADEEIVYL